MIELSYSLSSSWNERASGVDWARADETTLRYKVFLGDQLFIVNGVDFSAKWGWVPLLDFAACLVKITEELENGHSEQVFEFTESDAQLQFNRQGDSVLITSNYSNGRATVQMSELKAAANSYAERVLSDAMSLHQGLRANPSVTRWYPCAAKARVR
jgi:hypothetical protein